MKWDNFKNRFKKDARQQEVDVDMNAIWDALEPEVDALNKEESRRRFFVFWMFFIGLMVAGTSWFLLSKNDQQNDPLVKNEINQTTPTTNNSSATNEGNLKSISSLEKKETLDLQPNPTKKQPVKNQYSNNQETIQQTSNISNTNTQNVNPSLDKSRESNADNLKSNQISFSQKSKTTPSTFSKNTFANDDEKVNLNSDLNNIKNESNSKTISSDKKNQSTSLSIEKGITFLPSLKTFLTLEEKSIQMQIKHTASIEKNTTSPTLLEDENEKRKIKFSVGVYGGASLINRDLKAKDNSGNVLLENRNKYETSLEAIHYGVTFGAEHSGVRLSLGIQNTSIAERFSFNETQVTIDSILGVQSFLLNFTGDTIPVIGMIPETSTTKNKINIYNTYKMIDIPISIGYHRSFKKKWSAGIDATFITNISLKTKGSISNELAQEVDVKAEQNNIFKSKVGLNYQLGLSIGRTFNDKIELNFSPSFRFFPKDFSVEEYGVSQKYILFGGNLGLSYRF